MGDLAGGSKFETTLGSRPAPFLKWDPTVAPAAPAGYVGDPTVDHQVTGSPYGTNIFRIEGPKGSFTGSPNLCTNTALGDDPTATDDCIETNLFSIMGKNATRAGVQVMKTVTTKDGTGNYLDVFAKSDPGQKLVISGSGVAATGMGDDGSGAYFGRVYVEGAAPSDLAVTNVTDKPTTIDHVDPAQYGDKVHVSDAIYDTGTKTLTVTAKSGDPTATLALAGYPTVMPQNDTFTVPNLPAPPTEVLVTSNKGGSDSDDVVITGAASAAEPVSRWPRRRDRPSPIGQTVTLDGTGSTGTILAYKWTQIGGPAATLSNPDAAQTSFMPTAGGNVQVPAGGDRCGIGQHVDRDHQHQGQPRGGPAAKAGPDQLNVAPLSTVTLDGSASKFAASYSWVQQTSGPRSTLNNATRPTRRSRHRPPRSGRR